MSTTEISAKNLGPIANFNFKLDDYGITVLTGANGSGKSTMLEGVQKLASGETKYPLRDGQRRGELSAFGAKVAISGRSKHDGEFEVTSIQGRLDLATLVDPGLKSQEAADRARVRALVNINGVKPGLSMFTDREEFVGFAEIVGDELPSDDLTETAARVKRLYEAEARKREDAAEQETGKANGYRERIDGIDVREEADLEAARQAHNAAVAEKSRIDQLATSNANFRAKQEEAKQQLTEVTKQWQGLSINDAKSGHNTAIQEYSECQEIVEQLEKQLDEAKHNLHLKELSVNTARTALRNAENHFAIVDRLSQLIESDATDQVSQDAIDAAAKLVADADAEYNRVRTLVDAKELAKRAEEFEATATHHREIAGKLRIAAQATEDVLAAAIQCDAVRVEIEDGKISLVTNHPVRGESIPFSELSEGERWKIAIMLAAKQVGKGGLIVIPQEAYEGLDWKNRNLIHEYAKELRVYILTAEASKSDDTDALTAKSFAKYPTV